MTTFTTLTEATTAAQLFFSENFGYNDGVAIESACATEVSFYSKNDPAMDDTFDCIIEDGKHRFCKNGGDVCTQEIVIKFAIVWNNGKEDRYVHHEFEERGTSIQEYAKQFETSEEAQQLIDKNDWVNCWVTEIEVAE